ncbi:MAG: hypothetical protein LBT59_13345, partial [Clostridiales bacterium]|nr:hypothetical protein [Clostridiales bacterium]
VHSEFRQHSQCILAMSAEARHMAAPPLGGFRAKRILENIKSLCMRQPSADFTELLPTRPLHAALAIGA